MKNILFATTALVATATFASAEVTGSGPGTVNITGWAEMGVIGGNTLTQNGAGFWSETEMEPQFHTDVDVSFAMSGTADNGLTFGATVDLDENGAFGNTTQGGETIFVSAGGATLTMGDTDGAFDKVMQEVNLAAGSINDDETAHAGFSGNAGFDGTQDGQIARFDYAFSGLTASLSTEIDDRGSDKPVWGVGVRYSGEFSGVSVGFGIGHQAGETRSNAAAVPPVGSVDQKLTGVSVDATLANGLKMGVNHTRMDIDGTESSHSAIGLGYEMNALAVGVNYGVFADDDGDATASGFGIAASYDLGGGLSAKAGYGHSTVNDLAVSATNTKDLNRDSFSLGLAMSF
ncbi:porin [Marinovum sp.]|uniref:porin n=1 Tax=Marinovum sp. TaxID=2024839 RepID=UPI003A8CBEFE